MDAVCVSSTGPLSKGEVQLEVLTHDQQEERSRDLFLVRERSYLNIPGLEINSLMPIKNRLLNTCITWVI